MIADMSKGNASHALMTEASEIFSQMMRRREEGAPLTELRDLYQQWLLKRREASAAYA